MGDIDNSVVSAPDGVVEGVIIIIISSVVLSNSITIVIVVSIGIVELVRISEEWNTLCLECSSKDNVCN